MFVVLWKEPDTEGCREFLERDWFKPKTRNRRVEHAVTMKRWQSTARCTVSVKGKVVRLNYEGRNKSFNQKNGVDVGVSKLTFSDGNYSHITKYEWKPSGYEEFAESNIEITEEGLPEESIYAEAEGDKRLVAHMISERSPGLRRAKIAEVFSKDADLQCEVCKFSFSRVHGKELGKKFCEVHHKKQLFLGPRDTKLRDLAILCSNCHRMIHRTTKMKNSKGKIMSVQQFARHLNKMKKSN
jgi:hypothetical protein